MDGGWRKVRWLAAGAALLLLCVLLWRFTAGIGTPTVTVVAAPPVGTPGQPLAQAGHARQRPDGAGRHALDYRFSYEAPAVQGGRIQAELHWQAEWQVAPLPAAGWLGVRTAHTQWQANAALQAATGLQEAERAWLEKPFAVRMDADGQLAELRFAQGTPAPVAALLGAVAHAGQFVRPAEADAGAWQAKERDLTGSFLASYRVEGASRVVKQWSGSGVEAGQGDPLGLRQDTTAEFALRDGQVQTLTWTQQGRLQPPVDDEAAGSTFRTTLRLERKGSAETAWLAGLDLQGLEPFDASRAVAREPVPRPVAWTEVQRDLAGLGAAPKASQRAEVRDRLLQAMRHQPEITRQAEAALVGGGLAEPAERTLLEALVGAGTPEAQTAVARLITDGELAESLRDRALMAATMLQSANAAFVARLLASDRDQPARRSAVAVTLGAVAKDLAPRQPDRASDLTGALVGEARQVLGHATTEPSLMEHCNWLAALGNTGDAQALPLLLEALDDPREDVRIAAAHALRFQDPVATEEAMVLTMAADSSLDVRTALLHAARWQGAKSRLSFVEKALRFDRSEAVRLEAAFTLASWSVTAPGVRKALAEALAVEKSETVQEALRNYLTPGRIAAPFQLQGPAGVAK